MNNTHYISALPTGTILSSGARNYRVVKVLGQGGYGITYLATAKVKAGNVWVNGQFAIKEHFDQKLNQRRGTEAIVSNPLTENEIHESIDSFMVEAKRLHELHHLNIVPVNECFKANNTAYYVMQYIDGESLAEMVSKAPQHHLQESQALEIIKNVSGAVNYLHNMRMTHLDVKPENIMMQNDGMPVLIDFGLVKRYDSKGRPTTTNKAAGISDGYAPLEQYAGITTFTPEADIYALAATLLFMLSGKTPYKAGQMKAEIIESWLTGVASARVIRAIIHAMAVQSEYRTHSVNQFLKELDFEIIIGPDDGNGKNGGSTKPTKKIPQNPPPTPWDKIIKIGCAAIAILFGFIFALLFVLSMIGSCEGSDNAVEISDSIKNDSIVMDSPVKKGDEDNPSKPVEERVQATENKKPEFKPSSPDANSDKTDVIELANPDASQMARTYMGKFESGERTSENLSKAFEYALKADEETKAEIINKLKEVGYRPAFQY
jgi:serine/threonine protein kinase